MGTVDPNDLAPLNKITVDPNDLVSLVNNDHGGPRACLGPQRPCVVGEQDHAPPAPVHFPSPPPPLR
ncbi:MAG: hypothetical protein KAI66_16435, partial [Lentisphaeria bacterium]|nr:hypothetical protein [Lentisphaeria bacterium]